MGKTKSIYALLTRKCNLSCPHCDVKNIEDDFDRDKFLNQLLNFDGKIILFGGEPTFYKDRLFDIVKECENAGKQISSISTNLIKFDEELGNYYKKLGRVATSWNPNRFTKEQYDIWINNCKKLSKVYKVKPTLLITLDNDILDMGVDKFMNIVRQWDSGIFKIIKMEHFNGNNPPIFFDKVDDFLCELYRKWDVNINNEIFTKVKHWWCDCNGVYTLNPNGDITKGCPHDMKPTIPTECYSCERVGECRPCILQQYCSFPKNLAALVNSR